MQRVVPMLEYELALDVFVEADAAGSSAASGSVPRREAFMARLCEAPFDLHAGPWVRFGLLRHASDAGGGSTLVAAMHHIAGDEWSTGVLDRELRALTSAAADTPSLSSQQLAALPALPQLTVQYTDFAHWQREVLSVVSESQLAYWRATLGHGGPAPLELPTDRPRPKLQTFNGAYTAVAVDGEVVASLEGVRRRAGATMFMVLLAAFQLLLGRYSRQEAVCVGSPYAGRDEAGTQGIVGYFDSTLALLLELSGEPTFVELLGRARSAALGAFAHADVPFARVVDALGVARDASRTPVFQAMFVLLAERTDGAESGVSDSERGGGVASDLDDDSETIGTAKFDLTLFVEGSLEQGSLEYNTDLFDGATARRMAAHFARLLRSIAAAPGAAAPTLELMDDDERDRVLHEWAGEAGSLPSALCLHQLFQQQAQRRPTAEAATFLGATIDYASLDASAAALATTLRSDHGVSADTPVALCLDRGHGMLVAILGVLQAGGGYVPMDPKYPFARVASILETCGAGVVVTTEDLVGAESLQGHGGGVQLLAVPTAVVVSGAGVSAIGEPAGDAAFALGNLAYILFTSGSTGRPKGVELSHEAVLTCVHHMLCDSTIAVDGAMRYVQTTTYTFDVSVPEIFVPLCCGGVVALAKPDALLDFDYCEQLIRQQAVTMWGLVPSVLAAFVGHCAVPSCLRHVLPIGEALLPETCRRFFAQREGGTSLWNWYGPTEAAVGATILQVTPALAEQARVGAMPIGTFYEYHTGCVVDAALRPVGVGVPGELLLGGPCLARGYCNSPDLTDKAFIQWSPDGGQQTVPTRQYRTGDLVRWQQRRGAGVHGAHRLPGQGQRLPHRAGGDRGRGRRGAGRAGGRGHRAGGHAGAQAHRALRHARGCRCGGGAGGVQAKAAALHGAVGGGDAGVMAADGQREDRPQGAAGAHGRRRRGRGGGVRGGGDGAGGEPRRRLPGRPRPPVRGEHKRELLRPRRQLAGGGAAGARAAGCR